MFIFNPIFCANNFAFMNQIIVTDTKQITFFYLRWTNSLDSLRAMKYGINWTYWNDGKNLSILNFFALELRECFLSSKYFRKFILSSVKNNGPEVIKWNKLIRTIQYKYWLAQNSRRIHGIDTQHFCHNPIERKNCFPAH